MAVWAVWAIWAVWAVWLWAIWAVGHGCMGCMGCRPWLAVPQVESKVTLALGGIAVVLGAVVAAMGFLALLGLPSSLIILEVVPFLVLAVGADNIFIFVQEYQVWHPWVLRGRGVGIVCAIGCWGPYGVEGIGFLWVLGVP